MRTNRRLLPLFAAAAALACLSPASHATDRTIQALGNFTYSPSSVTAQVGDRLIFTGSFSFHPTYSGTNCTGDGRFMFESGSTGTYIIPADTPPIIGYFCGAHCGGGMWGTVTVTNAPPALGACCRPGSCTAMTEQACTAAGGTWGGFHAPCVGWPENPLLCCTANYNGIDGVTVQDLYDYITAWNASAGHCWGHQFYIWTSDITGDQCTTVQDLYDFLSLWNAGCH